MGSLRLSAVNVLNTRLQETTGECFLRVKNLLIHNTEMYVDENGNERLRKVLPVRRERL